MSSVKKPKLQMKLESIFEDEIFFANLSYFWLLHKLSFGKAWSVYGHPGELRNNAGIKVRSISRPPPKKPML